LLPCLGQVGRASKLWTVNLVLLLITERCWRSETATVANGHCHSTGSKQHVSCPHGSRGTYGGTYAKAGKHERELLGSRDPTKASEAVRTQSLKRVFRDPKKNQAVRRQTGNRLLGRSVATLKMSRGPKAKLGAERLFVTLKEKRVEDKALSRSCVILDAAHRARQHQEE
jgi:hypothetical protein